MWWPVASVPNQYRKGSSVIGRPTPCSSGSCVMVSNALSRTATPRSGAASRIPAMISRRNRVRFSSDAAEVARPFEGAQQLVAEVAVARLDVDEVEPRLLGELGRPYVVADERPQLVVGEQRCVRSGSDGLVEQRVATHRDRARPPVGLRVPPRMGQLDADHEIVGAAVRFDVGVHLFATDCRQRLDGVRGDEQLFGGAPAEGVHGDRFVPEHLRPASPACLPAASGLSRWSTVDVGVPALHRMQAEAIADPTAHDLHRAGQRRTGSRVEFCVEVESDAQLGEVIAKPRHRVEARQRDEVGHWSALYRCERVSASERAAINGLRGRGTPCT